MEAMKSWFGSVGDAYHWTINRADTEVKAIHRSIARRRLESELSDIVRTASGHKKDKVAQGDSRYQELWRIADGKVEAFCLRHGVPRGTIEAQVPALMELKQLAQPPIVVPHQNAKRVSGGIVTGVFALVILGTLCDLVSRLFMFGTHIPGWTAHAFHAIARFL